MAAPTFIVGPRMDIDAREWLDELDRKVTDNSLQLALLRQKQEHQYDLVNRQSDERLALINERFDRLEDALVGKAKADKEKAVRWAGWGGTIFAALCTAAWFTIVEPMQTDIAILERRLQGAETHIISTLPHASTE